MASNKVTVPVSEKDFLALDDDVPGQRFVCLSFLSPEKILEKKDVFVFSKFVENRCEKMSEMLDELSGLGEAFAEKAKAFRERHEGWMDSTKTSAEFEAYANDNEEPLNRKFYEKNAFQTSVRGIKVRGSYDTLAEAQARCTAIKEFDEQFNVYVATVGAWCPWDPSPESISDVEYSETELNTLMKKYKENYESKGKAYSESTATKVAAAIAEGKANIVKATKEGEIVATAAVDYSENPSSMMEKMANA